MLKPSDCAAGRLKSGVWTEAAPSSRAFHLEATALIVAAKKILLVEEVGEAYAERQALQQQARESSPHLAARREAEARAAGSQFDAKVVAAFLRVPPAEWDALRDNLSSAFDQSPASYPPLAAASTA